MSAPTDSVYKTVQLFVYHCNYQNASTAHMKFKTSVSLFIHTTHQFQKFNDRQSAHTGLISTSISQY